MEEKKVIKSLKVIYNNKSYDKITWFSISNANEYNKYEVSFENKEKENEIININCMLKDIEILTK